MKIRCGSHQQNRSIVRPGLSLMATKVALTAEEFRENSQRSIDLFNTEKLSTDSTHVQKKCILQFCAFLLLQSARSVWRQSCDFLRRLAVHRVAICTERVEAKTMALCCVSRHNGCNLHGACGGKVSIAIAFCGFLRCNLHGACGRPCIIPRKNPRKFMQTYCIFIHLGV